MATHRRGRSITVRTAAIEVHTVTTSNSSTSSFNRIYFFYFSLRSAKEQHDEHDEGREMLLGRSRCLLRWKNSRAGYCMVFCNYAAVHTQFTPLLRTASLP